MIYFKNEHITIRDLAENDAQVFCDGEREQGWDASVDKYINRLADRDAGKCVSLAADYDGSPAGYINIYPDCSFGAFGGRGLPEIIDFGVLQKYQRKGIGTALMDAAEKIAAEYADTVYLGVGLHSGYGSAQRMYAKRGYIPDGSGVWYGDGVCPQYGECCNDDELVLYMSKELK